MRWLLAPTILGAAGPRPARRLAPALAARTPVTTAAIAAVATAWSLVVLATRSPALVGATALALADTTTALGRFLEILNP